MARYNVTYEIVTEESAGYGDAEERGFIDENMDLRDAVEELFRTRTNEVDGIESIEPSCSDPRQTRWITVSNSMEYRTGAREARSLHIPDSVTPASRERLARLLTA